MNEIAQTLQTYGGWGVAAVCLAIIWRMGSYIADTHENQRKDDAAATAAAKEDIKTTVEALVETRAALRAFKEAMEVLARRLERLQD